jgi:hypothetical protein
MKTELIKNSPAQRYSKMSNLGICCSHCPSRTVVFGTCPRRVKVTSFENSPAQQDSKMSKCGVGIMRVIGVMGDMGQERIVKKRYSQRHSKISERFENGIAQLASIIFKFGGRLSGLFCWPQGQNINNSPAQQYSNISNGRLSGLFCWPQGQNINNSPAQPHSKFSNGRLSGLFCRWQYAQPHSNISKLVLPLCLCTSVVKRLYSRMPEC